MFKWLEKEPTLKQFLVWAPLSAIGYVVYCACMIVIAMHFEFMPALTTKSVLHWPILTWSFLPGLFCLALIEEFFFRFLPSVCLLDRKSSDFDLLFFILLTSWAFGMMHGGKEHLIFQGVAGLLFSAVYLKCGGIKEKYFLGLLASTVVHTCVNATIALLMLCNGADTF